MTHHPSPVAVIGLDRHGFALARAAALHPDLRLEVVADPRPERGRERAAELRVAFAPNYVEVLDDPTLDALIVAGAHPDRATVVAEAAVRGRTVLTLSPAATGLQRLDDVILSSAQGGGRVVVANPLRAMRATAEARRLVRERTLGPPLAVYASWRSKTAGDPLGELGPPLLDYLFWTLHDDLVSVQATSAPLFAPVDPDDAPESDAEAPPDTWLLIARFRSGLVATVELARSLPASFPVEEELRVEFLGTERVVVAEPNNLAVTIHTADGATRRDPLDADVARAIVDGFVPIVRDGAMPDESPVNARWAMPTVEAARRSAQRGAPVALGR